MSNSSRIEVGVAQRPLRGESVCGDAYGVVERDDLVCIALADGLGHGPDAAVPAVRFCERVHSSPQAPLAQLFASAHHDLSGTRGAAAAILRLNKLERSLEFAALGNVELRALCARPIHPVSFPGIVGQTSRRKITPFLSPLSHGDLLVLYTDGISKEFDLSRSAEGSAQALAEGLLADHGVARDDATCIVVRWHCFEVKETP
ncbi:MAG: SpoIIE family protein phosphatase [Myxococcaceae bacterium]